MENSNNLSYQAVYISNETSIDTGEPGDVEVITDKETPPSILQEMGRKPEICNLLEMGEAYEHFNMKPLTKEIDTFINSQIKAQGLEDNKASYKKIFETLLENSNAPRDDVYSLIERVNEYVVLQKKLIQLAKEKEEFEKKPIEEMTSKELRRKLEEDGLARI